MPDPILFVKAMAAAAAASAVLALAGGGSLPMVLSETCLFGALTVMLSAYPSGGEAALPLAASLAAVAGVLLLLSRPEASVGTLGIGVVGLFGVLFLGRFFGELSTG